MVLDTFSITGWGWRANGQLTGVKKPALGGLWCCGIGGYYLLCSIAHDINRLAYCVSLIFTMAASSALALACANRSSKSAGMVTLMCLRLSVICLSQSTDIDILRVCKLFCDPCFYKTNLLTASLSLRKLFSLKMSSCTCL